jgi:hypothetical protein
MDLPADSRSYIPASNRNALLVTGKGVGLEFVCYIDILCLNISFNFFFR